MRHVDIRQKIIKTALSLNETGLSAGASGNVSARVDGGFLITPSGVKYHKLRPEDIVFMDFEGNVIQGNYVPSSEWRFHMDIYNARDYAKAIVHAHPPYCTALACLNKGIPAFHYMVAVAGGKNIRCCRYEPFGTAELSEAVVKALDGRRACLMSHHGMIAYGDNLEKALSLAVEVEVLAQQYQLVLQMGEPELLSDEDMERVMHQFWTYGDNAQKVENEKRRKPRKTWKTGVSYPKRSTFYKRPNEKDGM
ncbi:MAG: class II aldolase/adducin family protein [Magnetovibrio sp.]|nr:class II aldolase/adducin family protein [Magnetovibrio sp.]